VRITEVDADVDRRQSRTGARRLANAVLVLTSLAVTAAALEAYFRVFSPQITEHDSLFEYDAELGWRFVAGREGTILHREESLQSIRTNADGFRDAPFGARRAGVRRIVVLGDSFVSNVDVAPEAVFTEVLESLLGDAEVFNLGVNGYGPVQESLLLRHALARFEPDLVLVQIFLGNDVEDSIDRSWVKALPRPTAALGAKGERLILKPPPPYQEPPGARRRGLERLHLFHFLADRWDVLRRELSARQAPDDPFAEYATTFLYLSRRNPVPAVRAAFRVMELLMLEMSRSCREAGVPLLFVVAPSIRQVDEERWQEVLRAHAADKQDYDRLGLNRTFEEIAARNGLTLLDLTPRLLREAAAGRRLYHEREQHWTAEGNRVVAEEIAGFLRRRGAA
jgi:hypothetical protein